MLCSGKTLSPKQKTTNKETGYSHSGPSTEEVEARESGGKGLPEPQRELEASRGYASSFLRQRQKRKGREGETDRGRKTERSIYP